MTTSPITTHVLDTSTGTPAPGVAVALSRRSGTQWTEVGAGTTDRDGRIKDLLATPGNQVEPGTYRLVFQTGAYFAARKSETFYPRVEVVFTITDTSRHYHVPLLVSPFGYSTYRGS